MKKSTLFYLSALCALPSLAVALPLAGDMELESTLTASDAVVVDEAGTLSAAAGSGAEFYFQPVNQTSGSEITPTLATFNADYTFDLPTFITMSRSGGSGNIFPQMKFAQGITVKFNNLNLTGTGLSRRAGYIFDMTSRTTNDALKAHIYVTTDSNKTFNAGNYQENWFRNINFHAQSAVNYGDIHFQYNASFHVESAGVELQALHIRQPYNYVSRAQADAATGNDKNKSFSAKIYLNGNSLKCHTVQWNSSQQATSHEGAAANDVLVDFGVNSVAQVLYFANLSEHEAVKQTSGSIPWKFQNNWSNNRFYLDNFGENDLFVLGVNPFTATVLDGVNEAGTARASTTVLNAISRMIVINGEYINDEEKLANMIIQLTAEDLERYGIADTSYIGKWAVIPEPSTYAIIFGAIALGFVAYRRKMR